MNIYIKDIPMRIGYPYLFRHVEYCDHMILLNDIRVMDKYDNFDKDEKAMGDVSHALFLCDYCLRKYMKMI